MSIIDSTEYFRVYPYVLIQKTQLWAHIFTTQAALLSVDQEVCRVYTQTCITGHKCGGTAIK